MKDNFKVIIAGSRDFDDYDLLKKEMDRLLSKKSKTHNIVIVSGCCTSGADQMAIRYAKENNYSIEKYPAEWDKYGKKAGPIRNNHMAKNIGSDACVVFWDGESKGSKNMIDNAKLYKLNLRIIYY